MVAVTLFASSPLLAQTGRKVLFDAGHSQMAGNADWVVDEDTCGSPQRFPTPPQSGITASTPETYWNGGYSAFGVDLAKAGDQIETLPSGVPITYGNASNVQDLSNYDVFIVPEPNVRFSDAEKSAILAFVQDCGGLFMISGHGQSDRNNDGWDSPVIFNDLGSDTQFGIHFQIPGEASSNIVDHPDSKYTADPASPIVRTGPAGALSAGKGLGLFNGTTFVLNTTVSPNAKGHIWATTGTADTSTLVTFATSTYGSGRVAAIGDSSPSEDATSSCGHTTCLGWNETAYDNAWVHPNAIAWLAGGTTCTDTTAPVATKSVTIAGTATYSIAGHAGTAGATLTTGTLSGTSDASSNYTIAGLDDVTVTGQKGVRPGPRRKPKTPGEPPSRGRGSGGRRLPGSGRGSRRHPPPGCGLPDMPWRRPFRSHSRSDRQPGLPVGRVPVRPPDRSSRQMPIRLPYGRACFLMQPTASARDHQ